MPIEPGPELLRDWIARAAQRHPAKPWIVCADDGRTVTYRELHEATGRIAAFLHSRGIEDQPAGGAARQQFHRASGLLFRRHGLWGDHLHRARRDEPQPARQHLRPAQAGARSASGRTGAWTTCSPPSRRRACGSDGSTGRTRGRSTPRSPAMSRATRRPPRARTTTPSSCSRRAPARGRKAWC